jgi:hypothetical protein
METEIKLCECGCGTELPAIGDSYPSGDKRTRPLRFIHNHHLRGKHHNKTHGMSSSPELTIYFGAKSRCTNPSNCNYPR